MKENDDQLTGPIVDISSLPISGMPETVLEMLNRYGTYEIQSTSDTNNMYPTIAQGFNKKQIKTDRENKDAEKYSK